MDAIAAEFVSGPVPLTPAHIQAAWKHAKIALGLKATTAAA